MARNTAAFLRRHPVLVGVAILLLLFRAALPVVLRSLLVTRGSEVIEGRLEVGDVDLWLLHGAVALRKVAVFSAGGEEKRLVAWDDLYTEIGWIDLLRRTIRFREIRLQALSADIERLPDDRINLITLLRSRSPGPNEAAEPDKTSKEGKEDGAGNEGPAWTVALDRLVVEHGEIRFRDLTVSDGEPVDIEIARLQVTQAASRRGVYDHAGRVELEARVLSAPLTLQAEFELDPQVRISSTANIQGLPVQHARFYLPVSGWTDLRGRLDATLLHELESGRRNELHGSVVLRDLGIGVAGLERPALSWESLAVKIGSLDLLAHQAKIEEVELRHPGVVLTPSGESRIPLISVIPRAQTGTAPSQEPGQPWVWSVGRVSVEDAHLLTLGTSEPLDFGLRIAAREVQPGGVTWPVEMEMHDGNASLAIDGSVRLEPVGFAGTVECKELEIPRLVAASGLSLPVEVRKGRVTGKLQVAAAMETPETTAKPGAVHLAGTVEVADLDLSESEVDQFGLSWRRLTIDLASLLVPGAIGGGSTREGTEPITLRVNRIQIEKPTLRLTRTGSGLVLPAAKPMNRAEASGAAEQVEGSTAVGQPAGKVEAGGAALGPASRLHAEVASVELTDGRLTFLDEAVTPAVRQRFSNIRLTARDIGWPARRIDQLSLEMNGPEDSRLSVKGKARPASTVLDLVFERLGLRPFDPYAGTYAGYGIIGGNASFTSRVELGENDYNSENRLVLHNLGVSTKAGNSLFRDQFGIPLTLALSLMSDVKGNITLDVPVSGDRKKGTRLGLMDTVLSTLRRTILNAISSPLKLIGSVVLREGKIEGLDVKPVSFEPGGEELDSAGREQLGKLAVIMSGHPALRVQLEATVGSADVRSLQERALLDALDRSPSSKEAEEAAGGAAMADRIRAHLEARVAGGAVAPEPAIEPILDDLLSQRKIPPESLRDLAAARASRVGAILEQEHHINAAQIEVAPPSAQVDDRGATVQVEIDTAS